MKTLCFLIVLICVEFIDCESIDYKKAAEIFKILRVGDTVYPADTLYPEDHVFSADPVHLADAGAVSRFINFMRDHHRVYSSRQDLFERHENFIANVERAETFQSLDRGTAEYSVTKYSDWSAKDLRNLTGLRFSSHLGKLPEHLFGESHSAEDGRLDWLTRLRKYINDRPATKSLPDSVDWREKGFISKPKDQGTCQSCYAFSVAGIVEGMHAIETGKLTPLSVQQIVDCDSSNYGCQGGVMDQALQYIMDDGGLLTEEEYPYVQDEHWYCLKSKVSTTSSPKVQVTDFERIPYGREDKMKSWIARNGPLSVGINGDRLVYYSRGIIDLDKYSCNPKRQNHAVIVVGYGVEKKKDGKSIPYWIVKNSWGEDWGEKGYFRMRMNTNTCGISFFVHGVRTN